MWFEARKQEKNIRKMMVDHRRRAERRKDFYDRIKKDPEQFMQLHGVRCKLHVDIQGEQATHVLHPWPGDSAVTIDRFDARAHLDFIPDNKLKQTPSEPLSKEAEKERRRCNYESYRILVVNEFEKTSEDKFLKQIFLEEHFGASHNSLAKAEEHKKKYLADKKAAIAYSYEGASGRKDRSKDVEKGQKGKAAKASDSDSEDSEPEFDLALDVSELTPEETKALEKSASKYGVPGGDLTAFMWEDKEEQDQLEELRHLEEARAALSGRRSRRERQLLKQKRILLIGKGTDATTTLSSARPKSPVVKAVRPRSSSSSSRSGSPVVEKIEYITSFSGSRDSGEDRKSQKPHSSSSRSRRPLTGRRRRSKSPPRERSRRSRDRRRRSHSPSSRKRSRAKPETRPAPSLPTPPRVEEEQRWVSPERSRESSVSSSASRLSMLSIRSSLSEDEQERRQVENRRRRLRMTKKGIREKMKEKGSEVVGSGRDSVETDVGPKSKGLSVREKMRLQTQKALKKTLQKDKQEERLKKEEQMKERMEREEDLREISSYHRQKERDKLDSKYECDRLLDDERRKRRHRDSSSSSSSSGSTSSKTSS